MLATRNLALSISAALLLLIVIAPSSKAQGSGIGNTTSTPVAGVPHDYITGLNETVNPANGAVSIRIAQPVPHERGQNWPVYAYAYDSNSVYQLSPRWGSTGSYTALSNLDIKLGGAPSTGLGTTTPNSVGFSQNTLTVCQQSSQFGCTTWTCIVYSGYNLYRPNWRPAWPWAAARRSDNP